MIVIWIYSTRNYETSYTKLAIRFVYRENKACMRCNGNNTNSVCVCCQHQKKYVLKSNAYSHSLQTHTHSIWMYHKIFAHFSRIQRAKRMVETQKQQTLYGFELNIWCSVHLSLVVLPWFLGQWVMKTCSPYFIAIYLYCNIYRCEPRSYVALHYCSIEIFGFYTYFCGSLLFISIVSFLLLQYNNNRNNKNLGAILENVAHCAFS